MVAHKYCFVLVISWCALCAISTTCSCRDSGTKIFSALQITPSIMEKGFIVAKCHALRVTVTHMEGLEIGQKLAKIG